MRDIVARTVTLMSYNIHQGRDDEDVLDLERIASVIRAQYADLVALQEVGRHWSDVSDFRDQAADLAQLTGMESAFGANLDRDPPAPGAPRRQYGSAILSAFAIVESENVLLPRASADNEQRGMLAVEVDLEGAPFLLYDAHLGISAEDRALQTEAILAAADGAAVPPFVLGDFNARPGARELAPLFERFRDAWTLGGEGDGFTFPAAAPTARIDYVLVPPQAVVREARVPALAGSDHLPLVVELALTA